MRILLLHNRYRAEGGEERAVGEQLALLRRRGHQVDLLERRSEDTGRITAARGLFDGGVDSEEVASAVRRLGAEVVHAHNLHPLLGWRALAAARDAGARTVVQLHNFRLFCAVGVAYRDGQPCHACRGANTLPGVRHRCRGGLPEVLTYAAGLHRQQSRLFGYADRFAVLSDSHGAMLCEHGLPGGRTDTLPNFIPDDGMRNESTANEGSYALVAGRLVEEKGFDTALHAARLAGVPLVVAGEGPDERRLRTLAEAADVRFTGWLVPAELAKLRNGAGVILVPSRCEEACPYSALEGLAAGVPVLGSDRGGLPELLGTDGLPAEDPEAWAVQLKALWSDPGLRRTRGEAALRRAREQFGESVYHERLMALYARALA